MLKPYMGFILDEPCEGAVLIFAHTSKEAKRIGWRDSNVLHDMTDSYVEVRIRYLKQSPYLFKEAEKTKLKKDIPHVIDSPTSCKRCELWGGELNNDGYCESCIEIES
jgi:hypothetical protein